MLTFRLSDLNEFHCSYCGHEVASAHNSRFIVNRVTDLIAAFKTHVEHSMYQSTWQGTRIAMSTCQEHPTHKNGRAI